MRPSSRSLAILAGLLAATSAMAFAVEPPAEGGADTERQREADRQLYLQREDERARVRNNPDYGRYDRADRNRARRAAQERMDARLGVGWAVGTSVHGYGYPLYVVSDLRGHGLRQPPRGSRWMRDDRGDLLLVVIDDGMISEVLPHE